METKKNLYEIERYKRTEDIVRLALKLQDSQTGMCLDDIMDYFNVSRRTAERMRDSILKIFGDAEAVMHDGKKYWKLKRTNVSLLPTITDIEMDAIDAGIKTLKRYKRKKEVAVLTSLKKKVFCLTNSAQKSNSEGIKNITLSEGLALQPSPQFIVSDDILQTIRNAIISCNEIKIEYFARSRNSDGEKVIQPYGFLYGIRHYLVGWSKKDKEFRYFTLSNIKKVSVSKRTFKPQQFSLEDFASRSFGVFQEKKVYEVIWEFSKKVSKDVLEYQFHPTQEVIPQKNGCVLVKFTACGLLEMVWHLFQWGDNVKIIAPKELKNLYKEKVNELKKVAK